MAQQQAALPGQQAAEQAGLDAAKTNAFGDINVTANDRGMSYSGMPITEQARYTGATYLPAVANLKNTYAQKGFALSDTLAKLEAERTNRALDVRNGQLASEQDAAAKVAAARASAAANPGLDFSLLGPGAGNAQAASTALPTFAKTANPNDVLSQMYAGYAPGAHPYYTENVVVPALKNLILQKLPHTANAQAIAESLAFKYRKANFGE